jgi:hypothetical protein
MPKKSTRDSERDVVAVARRGDLIVPEVARRLTDDQQQAVIPDVMKERSATQRAFAVR